MGTVRAFTRVAREGARIPLPPGLARDLAAYRQERLRRLTQDSKTVPIGGVADKPLFGLPKKQITWVFVDKDLAFAGIPKHDDGGRVLDIHCLRHTFITMLAKSGVSIQLAQKAARHSSPILTSNVYTHIGLDDLAGTLEGLPDLSPEGEGHAEMAGNSPAAPLSPSLSPMDGKNRARFGIS